MRLILFFSIFFSLLGHSQIIEIEDVNFKNKLLQASPLNAIAKDLNNNFTSIDLNGDGEIQVTEARNISYLNLKNSSIFNLLGINYFTNIKYIDVSNNNTMQNLVISNFSHLAELIVAPNTALSQVEISNNHLLKKLNVSTLFNLEHLNCSNNGLTELLILYNSKIIPKLTKLDCSQNQLSSFVSGYELNQLTHVDISNNKIEANFHFYGNTIKEFKFNNNLIDNLYVDCDSLESLEFTNNPIAKIEIRSARSLNLDVPTLPTLQGIVIGQYQDNHVLKSILSELQPSLKYLTVLADIETSPTFNNFPNLQNVQFYTRNTDITIKSIVNSSLGFSAYAMKSFSIQDCPNLSSLAIGSGSLVNDFIKNIKIENLPSLATLEFELPEDGFILKNLPGLKNLYFYKTDKNEGFMYNFSQNINKQELPNLENLRIEINPDTNNPNPAIVKDFPHLKNLEIKYSHNLGDPAVFFDHLPSLQSLKIKNVKSINNSGEDFIFGNHLNLENLEILLYRKTSLSHDKLIFYNLPKLKNFSFTSYTDGNSAQNINLLDLSTCPSLENFNLQVGGSYSTINFLNLKNSNSSYNSFTLNFTKVSQFCLDTIEEKNIISNLDGIFNINATYDCGIYNDAPYNLVYGTVLYDYSNNNCVNNSLSVPTARINFLSPSNSSTTYALHDGKYSHFLTEVNQTVNPSLIMQENYYNVSSSINTLYFSTYSNSKELNFCLSPKTSYNDLEISIIPIDQARPGFETKYKILYANNGTTIQSGSISLNFEGRVMSLSAAEPATDTSNVNELIWGFDSLKPFEKREILAAFKLNSPTNASNPLNGGESLQFKAIVKGAVTDETPPNNTFVLNETVVNSFDPNDKICLEGGYISPDFVGDDVHYKIRFENTGTANATNVIVKDFINTSKFDINSLHPIAGSHPFVTRIKNGNEVNFIFENINLPYTDEHNDGYLVFKIKTLNSLQVGDTIENSAQIYFDYNLPIETDPAISTFQVLSTDYSEIKSDFSFYPVPLQERLKIKSAKSLINYVEVFDSSGKLITQIELIGKKAKDIELDVNFLPKGMYVIKLKTENGTLTEKVLK